MGLAQMRHNCWPLGRLDPVGLDISAREDLFNVYITASCAIPDPEDEASWPGGQDSCDALGTVTGDVRVQEVPQS